MNRKRESASALLLTLVLAASISVALASYLKLIESENQAVSRSMQWNSAIPASEAGIEEALTHLNLVGDGPRGVDGWTVVSNSFYMVDRIIGDARYQVYINSSNQPSVVSIAYTKAPRTGQWIKRTVMAATTRIGSGMRGMLAREGITMTGTSKIDSFDSEDPAYSTNGRYDALKAKDGGYAGAIGGNVDTGQGGIWGNLGTGPTGKAFGNAGDKNWMASQTGIQFGHYSRDLNLYFEDVKAPFSNGWSPQYNVTILTTNYTYLTNTTTSTTLPNPIPANLKTNVQTFTSASKPFNWSGTLTTNIVTLSASADPGSKAFGNVVQRNVVEGSGQDRKISTYYDYQAISGYTYNTTTYSWNSSTEQPIVTSVTYTMALGSGNYQVGSLSLSGQDTMIVTGDAVLYVSGDVSISGQGGVLLMPGASLKLYVGGASTQITGNGILNLNGDAAKFSYYGLVSNTSITMTGNANFVGTIYAPSAHFHLGGGGNDGFDFIGASVTRDVAMNGHFNFHYDEKLGRMTGKVQFRVASWNEI